MCCFDGAGSRNLHNTLSASLFSFRVKRPPIAWLPLPTLSDTRTDDEMSFNKNYIKRTTQIRLSRLSACVFSGRDNFKTRPDPGVSRKRKGWFYTLSKVLPTGRPLFRKLCPIQLRRSQFLQVWMGPGWGDGVGEVGVLLSKHVVHLCAHLSSETINDTYLCSALAQRLKRVEFQ